MIANTRITEFQVVNSTFPIPIHGILGHTFLKDNNTIIKVALWKYDDIARDR